MKPWFESTLSHCEVSAILKAMLPALAPKVLKVSCNNSVSYRWRFQLFLIFIVWLAKLAQGVKYNYFSKGLHPSLDNAMPFLVKSTLYDCAHSHFVANNHQALKNHSMIP